jgi:hypothetical protein
MKLTVSHIRFWVAVRSGNRSLLRLTEQRQGVNMWDARERINAFRNESLADGLADEFGLHMISNPVLIAAEESRHKDLLVITDEEGEVYEERTFMLIANQVRDGGQ